MQNDKTRTDMPGMKWHYVLIYFTMWSLTVSSVFGAYGSFSFREMYSEIFHLTENTFIAFAIIYAVTAVYTVISRFALARFKKYGPVMMNIACFVSMLLPMVINWIERYAVGFGFDFYSIIVSAVTVAAILILNTIYYRKRSHLFVK